MSPAAGAAAAPEGSATPRLSIGQVLQRLAKEFPDLTDSKLRFLEDKGLVRPARTAKGYRKYSMRDVERIRQILALQRDRYLPLRVIADYFDRLDRGLEPELPGDAEPPAESMLPIGTRLDRNELLRRSQAGPALLDQAVAIGLIPPGRQFGAEELALLCALVSLERAGIEPRHLRPFLQAARHEAGLVEQALPGGGAAARRSRAAGEGRTEERQQELLARFLQVRQSLAKLAMRQISAHD